MKKLFYTLLALSFALTNCSKDDDNDNPFLGKWLFSSAYGTIIIERGYEFYKNDKCIFFDEERGKDPIRIEEKYYINDNTITIKRDGDEPYESDFNFSVVNKDKIVLKKIGAESELYLVRYK